MIEKNVDKGVESGSRAGSGSVISRNGSADPDHNETVPLHCNKGTSEKDLNSLWKRTLLFTSKERG